MDALVVFITEILGITADLINGPIRDFHTRFIKRSVIIVSAAITIGFLTTVCFPSLATINLIFASLLIVLIPIIVSESRIIATLTAISVASGIKNSPETIEDDFKKYASIFAKGIKEITLYLLSIFLILGTWKWFSFWGGLVILISCIVIKLAGKGEFFKKFIYKYAIYAIIAAILFSVPRYWFVMATGYDAMGIFENNRSMEAATEIMEIMAKNKDLENEKKLLAIKEKVQRKEELSKEEKEIFSKFLEQETIFGKAKRAYNNASEKLSKVKFPEMKLSSASVVSAPVKPAETVLKTVPVEKPVPVEKKSASVCKVEPPKPVYWTLDNGFGQTASVKVEKTSTDIFIACRDTAFRGTGDGKNFYGSWSQNSPRLTGGEFLLQCEGDACQGWDTDMKRPWLGRIPLRIYGK